MVYDFPGEVLPISQVERFTEYYTLQAHPPGGNKSLHDLEHPVLVYDMLFA